jgi:hypothetical protein
MVRNWEWDCLLSVEASISHMYLCNIRNSFQRVNKVYHNILNRARIPASSYHLIVEAVLDLGESSHGAEEILPEFAVVWDTLATEQTAIVWKFGVQV